MTKQPKRATTVLADLERRAADAAHEAREAQAEIDTATKVLEQLRERRIDAHAAGDAGRADALSAEIDGLEAQLDRHSARAEGLERRRDAAIAETKSYRAEHAMELLEARQALMADTVAKLNASVNDTVRLHRAVLAERQEQDRLVAVVPGGAARLDGPPSSHEWEKELTALDRVVRKHPELDPPSPRWHGVEHRRAEADRVRRLRLGRKNRTGAELS